MTVARGLTRKVTKLEMELIRRPGPPAGTSGEGSEVAARR